MRKYVFFFFFFIILFPKIVFADTAHSTIVMDISSGRVLYSKDAYTERLIASITKIMTI